MIIIDAIQSVFTIVLMIAIGYFLTYKGWFDEHISNLFSKLVVNISLPAYMISNIMSTFTKEDLMQAGVGLFVPLISIFVSYIVGIAVSKVLKISPGRQGMFQSMFALSNTIFVGLPVGLALFGEKSIPYVLLYYIVNTTIFWTIGVYSIRCDGQAQIEPIFTLNALKKIFSLPLMAFIIAVVLVLAKVHLPKFVMDTCKYMGSLTTPLSMLFIGIVIYYMDFKQLKFDKETIMLLIGRFLITPMLVLIITSFIPIPDLMRRVFVIIAAMPVMTQTAILAKTYKADYNYAAAMITTTTIASLIFIPFYMYLLSIL